MGRDTTSLPRTSAASPSRGNLATVAKPNRGSDLEAITLALADLRILRVARKVSFLEDEILHELDLAECGDLKTRELNERSKHVLQCVGAERRHANAELHDPGWFTAAFTLMQYRVDLLLVGERVDLYSVCSRRGEHNDGSTMPRVNREHGELVFPRLFAWRGRNYPMWYGMARLWELSNGRGPVDHAV